ncbi:hypothetical protein [Terracidiphilus gabretensis]|uniref:hypothetical protein n=1 Tax=Terracidiphilus gabretensis TaxID=1577687 RepID=UPI00071B6184|nr:hypothetical protein [Terracidiphilus gabretensis]
MNATLNRRRTLAIAAFTLAALLSPNGRVEACGPFFEPEVFIRNTMPDNLAAFAKGQLGIIQPGFDSDEYAIAYRYLNGGTLDAKEQSVVKPSPHEATDEEYTAQEEADKTAAAELPPNQWRKARNEILPASAPAHPIDPSQPDRFTNAAGAIIFQGDYLNCPDPAYANALLTLRKRAATWGNSSPALFDWIRGQDTVFSNCNGQTTTIPSPALANSPILLRADRAYQIAAANLYAKKYDEAAQQFTAIAGDKDSPWHDWGTYLAARATVRKAFATGKTTDPYSGDLANFDPATMKQAQQMLESLLAEPHPVPSREAITAELNFIRIRTELAKRIAEISAALTGPAHDPHFAQNLADLNWILIKGALNTPQKDKPNYLQMDSAPQPALIQWIAAWRGPTPTSTMLTNWQQSHALPWLVVAIANANVKFDSAAIPELLSAAAAIPSTSPAYQTVFYHRVRLLLELNHLDEARALLDPALAATKSSTPDSWRNALLAERLSAARDFNEFLTYAPRTALESGSQAADNLRGFCNTRAGVVLDGKTKPAPCPELDHALTFDADAATIFNEKTPLIRLIEAAQSPIMPAHLRQNIAIIAWTRAIMLEDAKSAAILAPLLPKSLGITATTGIGLPATLAILRNEGIRPYLEPGIARVASYSEFDNYSDNWWCQPTRNPGQMNASTPPSGLPSWLNQRYWTSEMPAPALPPPSGILTSQDQQQAAAESVRLKQLPDSADLLGQRVLDYAKTNPADPNLPEALHLTVRATRYGCAKTIPNPNNSPQSSSHSPTSKAAFQLLHKNFPNSPWTAKTPYYF